MGDGRVPIIIITCNKNDCTIFLLRLIMIQYSSTGINGEKYTFFLSFFTT